MSNSNRKNKILNLIKSYSRAGELPLMISIAPFFLTKPDREKKLQLFRDRLNIGIHRKLEKKYYRIKITDNYESKKKKSNISENSIWFMWLQDVNNSPELVRENYFYLKRLFSERLVLITSKNIFEYIDLPKFIITKWQNGQISNTHFSDIVRVQLLDTYGGTWIDSTVIVKKKFIQDLSSFIIPQTFAPGSNGMSLPISSWFIHSDKMNNNYISRVRDMLFEYWKVNNYLIDYFLLHHFFIIVSKEQNNYLDTIQPLDNTISHYLMLKMRKRAFTSDELKSYYNQFDIMKFTNKPENKIEENNYQLLTNIIKKTDVERMDIK